MHHCTARPYRKTADPKSKRKEVKLTSQVFNRTAILMFGFREKTKKKTFSVNLGRYFSPNLKEKSF